MNTPPSTHYVSSSGPTFSNYNFSGPHHQNWATAHYGGPPEPQVVSYTAVQGNSGNSSRQGTTSSLPPPSEGETPIPSADHFPRGADTSAANSVISSDGEGDGVEAPFNNHNRGGPTKRSRPDHSAGSALKRAVQERCAETPEVPPLRFTPIPKGTQPNRRLFAEMALSRAEAIAQNLITSNTGVTYKLGDYYLKVHDQRLFRAVTNGLLDEPETFPPLDYFDMQVMYQEYTGVLLSPESPLLPICIAKILRHGLYLSVDPATLNLVQIREHIEEKYGLKCHKDTRLEDIKKWVRQKPEDPSEARINQTAQRLEELQALVNKLTIENEGLESTVKDLTESLDRLKIQRNDEAQLTLLKHQQSTEELQGTIRELETSNHRLSHALGKLIRGNYVTHKQHESEVNLVSTQSAKPFEISSQGSAECPVPHTPQINYNQLQAILDTVKQQTTTREPDSPTSSKCPPIIEENNILAQRNADLTHQVKRLEREKAAIQLEYDKTADRNNQMTGELDAARKQIAKHDSVKVNLQGKESEARSQLAECQTALKNAKREVEEFRQLDTRARNFMESEEKFKEAVKQEVNGYKRSNDDLKKQIIQLKTELKQLRRGSPQEARDQKRNSPHTSKGSGGDNADVQELLRSIEQLNHHIAIQDKQIFEDGESLEKAKQEILDLQVMSKNMQRDHEEALNKLEKKLHEAQADLRAEQKHGKKLENNAKQAMQDKADWLTQEYQLQNSLSQMTAANDLLQQEATTLKQALKEQRSTIAELTRTEHRMDTSVQTEDQPDERATLQQIIEGQKLTIAALTQAKPTSENSVQTDDQTDEIEALKQTVSELRLTIAAYAHEEPADGYQAEVEDLKERIQTMQQLVEEHLLTIAAYKHDEDIRETLSTTDESNANRKLTQIKERLASLYTNPTQAALAWWIESGLRFSPVPEESSSSDSESHSLAPATSPTTNPTSQDVATSGTITEETPSNPTPTKQIQTLHLGDVSDREDVGAERAMPTAQQNDLDIFVTGDSKDQGKPSPEKDHQESPAKTTPLTPTLATTKQTSRATIDIQEGNHSNDLSPLAAGENRCLGSEAKDSVDGRPPKINFVEIRPPVDETLQEIEMEAPLPKDPEVYNPLSQSQLPTPQPTPEETSQSTVFDLVPCYTYETMELDVDD